MFWGAFESSNVSNGCFNSVTRVTPFSTVKYLQKKWNKSYIQGNFNITALIVNLAVDTPPTSGFGRKRSKILISNKPKLAATRNS